jgi:hypothetical protein
VGNDKYVGFIAGGVGFFATNGLYAKLEPALTQAFRQATNIPFTTQTVDSTLATLSALVIGGGAALISRAVLGRETSSP